MFYFPVISSRFQIDDKKRILNKELANLYPILHSLVHWEETYILETRSDQEPEHLALLNIVAKLLGLTEYKLTKDVINEMDLKG